MKTGLSLVLAALCSATGAQAQAIDFGGNDDAGATHLYADCTATANGDGRAAKPFWRITDALAQARKQRSAPHASSARIIIHVAPGRCTGNWNANPPAMTAASHPEALPLIINVPRLTLSGSTKLTHDSSGLPTGTVQGTESTVYDNDTFVDIWRLSMLVAPGDGMRPDGAIIEGMVFDSFVDPDNGAAVTGYISIEHSQGFILRRNYLVNSGSNGMQATYSSGLIVGNLTVNDGGPGLVVGGGSVLDPSIVSVAGNRSTGQTAGLIIVGTSGEDLYTLDPGQTITVPTNGYDLGANTVKLLLYNPNPYPSKHNPGLTDPWLATVSIFDNDLSGNYFGIRFMSYGAFHLPYQQTADIIADTRNNQINNNGGFGIVFDEGFVWRPAYVYYWGSADPFLIRPAPFGGPYQTDVDVILDKNSIANNGNGATDNTIFSFSIVYTADDFADWAPYIQSMSNSIYRVQDLDNELAGNYRVYNPATDDCQAQTTDPFEDLFCVPQAPGSGPALHNKVIISR